MDETKFQTRQCVSERDVIRFYDDYAPDWDARFGHAYSNRIFFERRWQVFENAIPDEVIGGVAAELGVGTGYYIDRCAKLFRQIIAVDGSERMLAQVARRLNEQKITNVDVMQMEATRLTGIPSGSVDLCYFFGLIEHIIDSEAFVSEIRRVLRPNGFVIAMVSNAACPWYRVRKYIRNTYMHCSTDRYYRKDDLKALFSNGGFDVRKIEEWGAVPAGLRSKLLTNILIVGEKIALRTPLRQALGGLVLVARSRAT